MVYYELQSLEAMLRIVLLEEEEYDMKVMWENKNGADFEIILWGS